MFLTQVLNGLQLGSIYALVALGYTMVYGIILLLNFAHGDIIMFGSYVAWIALVQLGLNPAIAVLLAIFGCVVLGVLIDKVAYAPLREAPRLSILITAIGVSYLLENGVQLLLGADAKVVPSIIDLGTVQVFGSTLSGTALLTVAVTIVATVVLTLLVQKTRLGKAMRAVSEDMGAARLMGVNVNSTISFTFAVGSALAGHQGICCSSSWRHWLHSWRCYWWPYCWLLRGLCCCLWSVCLAGCSSLLTLDSCSYCQTNWPAWSTSYRESVRRLT